MKRLKTLMALAILASACSVSVDAGINLGNKQSGFLVSGSAQLSATGDGGLVLTSGTLRTTSTNATSISGTLHCNNTKLEIDDVADDRTFEGTMDGTYTMNGGSIALGDNQTLTLEGGTTEAGVTTSGSTSDPSVIQGFGDFGSGIAVATGQVNIDLQSTLNVSITNLGTVKLLDNLVFADNKKVDGGTLDCNGNQVIFGSHDLSLSAMTLTDSSSTANFGVELNGKVTLGGTLTASSAGSFNGQGNILDLNANVLALGSNNLYLSDITLASMNNALITGTGDLFCSNVTVSHLDSENQGAIKIDGVDGAARVSLGTESSFFDTAAVQFVNAVSLELLRPVNLSTTWNFDGKSYINGLGNTLDLTNGILDISSNNLYITDLRVTDAVAGSLTVGGDIYAHNLTWQDAGGEATFTGTTSTVGLAQISPTNGLFFGNNVTFDSEVMIDLHKPSAITTGKTWTFSGSNSYLNGHGLTLDLTGALDHGANSLYISDTKLIAVDAGSIASSNGGYLYLNNTRVSGSGGDMTVTGNGNSSSGYAQLTLPNTDSSFYAANITFENGANIELNNDVTLSSSASWTFSGDTVINGNGHVLDIQAGGFVISADTTVYLRNVILSGLTGSTASAGDGQIHFVNASTSDLNISDTVICLTGNVTFSQGDIHVVGPSTIITGTYNFTTSSNGDLYVNRVTLWWDPLSYTGANNVTPYQHDGALVHFSNGGVIKEVLPQGDTSLAYPNAAKPFLDKSHELYHAPASSYDYLTGDGDTGGEEGETATAPVLTITFSVGDNTISPYDDAIYSFDGNGRFLHFNNNETSSNENASEMMIIEDSVILTTRHVALNGLLSRNISIGTGASLTFGDETTIKLERNDVLNKNYVFGTSSGDEMVLDLNGHELNMNSKQLVVTDGTLIVRNGKISGLSSSTANPFVVSAATSHIRFEDVDFVMTANTNIVPGASGGTISIKGNCSINGVDGSIFHFDATGSSNTKGAERSLTVLADSMLTVETGISLKFTTLQNAAGATDRMLDHLVLTDGAGTNNGHGTLNLHGGSLIAAGAGELLVAKGRLIADHRATLDASANTIRIGASTANEVAGYNGPADATHDLTIELEPGTTLNITGGIVKYDNFAG